MTEGAAAQEATDRANDEEFEVGFFQGYVDLRRRASLDHPDWDLTSYRLLAEMRLLRRPHSILHQLLLKRRLGESRMPL